MPAVAFEIVGYGPSVEMHHGDMKSMRRKGASGSVPHLPRGTRDSYPAGEPLTSRRQEGLADGLDRREHVGRDVVGLQVFEPLVQVVGQGQGGPVREESASLTRRIWQAASHRVRSSGRWASVRGSRTRAYASFIPSWDGLSEARLSEPGLSWDGMKNLQVPSEKQKGRATMKPIHTPEYTRMRERLKEARKAAGLTQEHVAKELDTP